MDIVYPVRKGEWNEELRYSLRSLANLPHKRVILAGHCPRWVKGVEHLKRAQLESKYRNATGNLIEAARSMALSDPFVLMNDDYYILRKVPQLEVFHLGPLAERIELYQKMHHRGAYWRGMVETGELLSDLGFPDPLSYEGHRPLPVYKGPLLEAWNKGQGIEALHIRTLYGNLAGLGGTFLPDSKVYRGNGEWRDWTFLSSNDDITLTRIGPFLQELFPNPGRYE